jgi:hypothetical protein
MDSECDLGIRFVPLLPFIKGLVRCKICRKEATRCFVSHGGGFILFCEPCFETYRIFFKRELIRRREQGIIIEDELENYI